MTNKCEEAVQSALQAWVKLYEVADPNDQEAQVLLDRLFNDVAKLKEHLNSKSET